MWFKPLNTVIAGFVACCLGWLPYTAQAATPASIEAALKQAVCNAYSELAPCNQLSIEQTHPLPSWLAEATLIEATYLNTLKQFSPQGIVRLVLTTQHGQHRQLGLPVHVIWQRPVWVVTLPVEAGQPILPEQLKATTLIMDHQAQHLFDASQPFPPDTWQAVLSVPNATPLDARKLRHLPWVSRGQEVTLTLEPRPGLKVGLKVVALEDGYQGQSMRVKQMLPVKKIHTVTVVGKGQVARLP